MVSLVTKLTTEYCDIIIIAQELLPQSSDDPLNWRGPILVHKRMSILTFKGLSTTFEGSSNVF